MQARRPRPQANFQAHLDTACGGGFTGPGHVNVEGMVEASTPNSNSSSLFPVSRASDHPELPDYTNLQNMQQRLEFRLHTPVSQRPRPHQQRDSVVQPECPFDTPMEYDSGAPHSVMFDGHRDSVMVNNPGADGMYMYNQMTFEKRTSPYNNHNLTPRPKSLGKVITLDSGAQRQLRPAGMDFGGASPEGLTFNTRVDSSTSDWHYSQNDPAQRQMQALVAQHGGRHGAFNTHSISRRPPSGTDRGSPVAVVSMGARNGGCHFQQQNGTLLGKFFQLRTSDNLLTDATATITNGSPESPEYFHDEHIPESVYARSRSNRESKIKQDTRNGNLVRRLKQMPMVHIQVSLNHVAQPIKFPYSYQNNPDLSYREYLNSFRIYPPHDRPSCTDSRPHQNPHSDKAISPARLDDAALEEFPSCHMVETVLGGAGGSKSVNGLPKSDALAAKHNGGRRQGPLGEDARAQAASTRQDGSCWHCKLQRAKCAEIVSGMCLPCRKALKPSRFGCKRDTLPSLAKYLLAASLLDQHQPEELSKIMSTHIQGWYHDSSMHIYVKWAHGSPIKVEVQEFSSNGNHLLYQDQYVLENGAYKRKKVASLPIGMTETLLRIWSPEMHIYLDRTLDEPGFSMFPENCFRGSQNMAQRALIHAMSNYNSCSSGERKSTLRNSLKLLLCTKLASYTLNLDEDNKKLVLQRLRKHATSDYGKFTSSRFLNREIKHVVADIHRVLLKSELHQLQEALQASDREREFWGPTLVSMLSLAMVTEIMQHLVQCKASSEIACLDQNDPDYMRLIREIEKRAADEIADMEYVMQFLRDLFSRKYISQEVDKSRGFKPIFKTFDRDKLELPSQCFAADLKDIIQRFGDFFVERKQLSPPQGSDNPCISRLVAELLLTCTPRAEYPIIP